MLLFISFDINEHFFFFCNNKNICIYLLTKICIISAIKKKQKKQNNRSFVTTLSIEIPPGPFIYFISSYSRRFARYKINFNNSLLTTVS